MSRVYFHSPEDTAEVSGSERAYMGSVINELSLAIINPKWQKDKLLSLLPPSCYLKNDYKSDVDWARDFSIWFSVGMDGNFLIDGKHVELFGLALNTAYKLGNDVVRLMVRIHGQCEIHCWIPGRDRAWITGIIESGLQTNLLRSEMGWNDVIKLLNLNSKTPVVLSYSVCDGFPNPYGLGRSEGFSDKFWDMPYEEQWRLAFSALKKSRGGLKICRETWNDFYYNDGMTAMDIINRPMPKENCPETVGSK